jgi:hypothetical protein
VVACGAVRRGVLPLAALFGAAMLHSGSLGAQTRLEEGHAAGYYAVRSAGIVALSGLSLAIPLAIDVSPSPPATNEWFPGDRSVRANLSAGAAQTSDVSLVSSITIPLAAELGSGDEVTFANTTLVYAEVLSVNMFANTVVKYGVQRPRPYASRSEPETLSYIRSEGRDAYLSFYSGHASTAFAAAVSGSYMFAATHPDSSTRLWMWGVEFALASATATLRVRAGKHYYSDVIVGAAAGSAIGIGVPLLEGVRYKLGAEEIAFLGGGLVVGVGLAEVLHFAQTVVVPVGALAGWTLAPGFGPHGARLSIAGRF